MRPSVNLTKRIDTPLGRFVVSRMIELGFDWARLSVATGLSMEGIKRICSPENKTTHESLEKLAKGLSVDIETLKLYREGNQEKKGTNLAAPALERKSDLNSFIEDAEKFCLEDLMVLDEAIGSKIRRRVSEFRSIYKTQN